MKLVPESHNSMVPAWRIYLYEYVTDGESELGIDVSHRRCYRNESIIQTINEKFPNPTLPLLFKDHLTESLVNLSLYVVQYLSVFNLYISKTTRAIKLRL